MSMLSMTRPDILRFNPPNSGNTTFDPDCETLLEWATRVFTGAPVEVEISELRTELPNVWVRVTSVAEPTQPLSVYYRDGWVHVTASDLVGQVITPFTSIRSDKLKATVVPNANWETLVSPSKREVPPAVSHAAVASHTMAADVVVELLEDLSHPDACAARAALVVFHGWSISAALAADYDASDILTGAARKALTDGPLARTTTAAVFDRVASWCTMAHIAVVAEIKRLELIQDLYRIRAGLDPYICGPLALKGEQHTIAEAEAAETENVPRWTKNHLDSALVAARTEVARAGAAVIVAAQDLHGSARVLDADGERWSVGGAEYKELDLAVDALNFAEQRLIDAREAAEGFVD